MKEGTAVEHYIMLLQKVTSIIKYLQGILCAVIESLSVNAVHHIKFTGEKTVLDLFRKQVEECVDTTVYKFHDLTN